MFIVVRNGVMIKLVLSKIVKIICVGLISAGILSNAAIVPSLASKSSVTEKNEIQVANDFNENTNQKISIYGISFQIPKEWQKDYSAVDECYYFNTNVGLDILSVREVLNTDVTTLTFSDARESANVISQNNSATNVSLLSVSGYTNNAFTFNASMDYDGKSITSINYSILTGKSLVILEYYKFPESMIDRNGDIAKVYQSVKLSEDSLKLYKKNQNASSKTSDSYGSGSSSGGPWYTMSGSCYHEKYGCSGATIPYPPKNKNYRPCSKCCR